MYVDIVKDVIDYYSDPEKYVTDYAKKIRSHVEADPRFEFTIDDFDLNTSKSEEGLQYSEEDPGNAWGNWGGFGGDASFDWANVDWENMDWGNMDWGDMDWGDMDWGNGMFGNSAGSPSGPVPIWKNHPPAS